MKKLFPLFLAGILAGILAGSFSACASKSAVIAGDLKIVLSRIERERDGTLQVSWQVDNPNVVSYLFSKGVHKIMLNGTYIGTITQNDPLGIPANTKLERTVSLVPHDSVAKSTIDQAVIQGTASYLVESTVMLLIIDDDFEKIHFTRSGTVPIVSK